MSNTLQEYRMQRSFRARLIALVLGVLLIFLIMFIKLMFLQVVDGAKNQTLAKRFASLHEYIVAPRGIIYDRNYPQKKVPLVQNIRYIDYVIYPNRFTEYKKFLRFVHTFCQVMNQDCSLTTKPWLTKKSWQTMVARNVVLPLMERLTREEQERLSAFRLTGTYGRYVTKYMRHYILGHGMAHVTGFIGQPNASDIKEGRARPYQTLGKTGIEKVYNTELRGRDGLNIRYRSVNTQEQIAEIQPGHSLILHIDKKIQSEAYRALIELGKRGTAIVMEPDTGAILALAVTPSYDPNILSGGDQEKRREQLAQIHEHQAFLNVAIQAKYPPASLFKILGVLAALEMEETNPKRVDPLETVFCPGHYVVKSTQPGVPDAIYKCWEARGHGHVNMQQGLAKSCDVFFYNLGYHVGPSVLIDYAKAFGLNRSTGVDLPGEVSGVVPDQKWKQYHFSSRWYDGDTLNLVIGQGFLETTPMAMALLYSAVLNRGKLYRPQIVREVRDDLTGQLIQRKQAQLIRELPISSKNEEMLQNMMRDVVALGTARNINTLIPIPSRPSQPSQASNSSQQGLGDTHILMAGKTGTAQSQSSDDSVDHAWFVGYAPYGKPAREQILVLVFIESGISGGAVAAPIAQRIIKAAFENEQPARYASTPARYTSAAARYTSAAASAQIDPPDSQSASDKTKAKQSKLN